MPNKDTINYLGTHVDPLVTQDDPADPKVAPEPAFFTPRPSVLAPLHPNNISEATNNDLEGPMSPVNASQTADDDVSFLINYFDDEPDEFEHDSSIQNGTMHPEQPCVHPEAPFSPQDLSRPT